MTQDQARGAGADDLEILHPERELEIAGRTVVMREYGFIEGMRLAGTAAPIVHDLAALAGADEGDRLLEYAGLQRLFEAHVEAITAMVAQACNQPVAWVESLGDADGQALLLTWWAVNGPFFVGRVTRELQMRLADQVFAGATSTPASPPPATATPNGSDAARVVN